MRGKAQLLRIPDTRDGITPAYAGKSVHFLFLFCFIQDHPRLCGEKGTLDFIECTVIGSPPPMRGKVSDVFLQGLYTRITPAYAGKRVIVLLHWILTKDHPRLCGEKHQSKQLKH